jgi:hypothetical protein
MTDYTYYLVLPDYVGPTSWYCTGGTWYQVPGTGTLTSLLTREESSRKRARAKDVGYFGALPPDYFMKRGEAPRVSSPRLEEVSWRRNHVADPAG